MYPARAAQRIVRALIRWLPGVLLVCIPTVAQEPPNHTARSLAELQELAATHYQACASFSVAGVVCAVEAESRLVALRDDSATVLLELPHLDPDLRPGDGLAVEGTRITLMRNAAGILVGTAPAVEIDAQHVALGRSGRVWLAAGWQPVRLEWFNGQGPSHLSLTYEGPGVTRQPVPDAALRRRATDASAGEPVQPGLDVATYPATGWTVLPDFRSLTPVATGISANFDVSQRSQPLQVAMRFTGFLRISETGTYTFHLQSDDGARLFVGDPAARCTSTRLQRSSPPPTAQSLAQTAAGSGRREWVSLEGPVRFATRRGNGLELEIMDRDRPVSVLVASGARLAATNLADQRVRVTGICEWPREARTPRIVVPGADQLEIIAGPPAAPNHVEPLTMAARVRSLQPDEARRSLRALIRGVVTTATVRSCVVQDLTGAVFVRHGDGVWPHQPIVGESWEFEGVTDPGEFSPIVVATKAVCVGKSVLPPPIHPNWDQLINGSMDVELIEVPGVVLETTPGELTLLTRGGEVRIVDHYEYPLPYSTALMDANQTLPGSRIRVRGVFFAARDSGGQLVPGRFLLGDGMISVDEPAPGDPFVVPTRPVADLLRFSSSADLLSRFKAAGQVLYAQPGEYFLLDGTTGFRVRTKGSPGLAEGDLVEAVGFPQLSGPSPVLLEAQTRKTGSLPRPDPRVIAAGELSDERNDATLVQVEARLLSDNVRLGERVLELQAGRHHFLARLRTADPPADLLRPGGRLRLTGVYASIRGRAANDEFDGFELLLNRPADIVVLERGPWWTPRHTLTTMAVLLAGLVALLIWTALLRRTVAHRTALLEREISERQQAEQNRLLDQERARVAQDLHDDLGAGLAQIGLMGALAQQSTVSPDRSRSHLAVITAKSREMVAVLDEIVWAINPRHDTADSVTGYLGDYAQEFLRSAAIVCRIDPDCAQPTLALSSTQRHQLFLAFKEALTNVVKHAGADEVRVRIATTDGELRVTVEDNGKGIHSHPEETKGDGTLNMRTRLAKIGGRCEINPRPGGGTVVSLHLPVNV